MPGSLVAIVAASAAAAAWSLPVETVAGRFGELPHALPAPRLPHLDRETVTALLSPAFTIALLAGIEALLSAVVADGMIDGRHRPNTELIAQGLANVGSSLFGGIPATGAIARTATNVKSGARTPVAGMVHAATLLLIVLFFGRWAGRIPLASLAGILAVVAYHMSEWRSFASLLRGPASDVAVLLTTFLLTVLFDLTLAIEVGMVLAAFLFMHRMARAAGVQPLGDDTDGPEGPRAAPPGVQLYAVQGPFFFGVAHSFQETMRVVSEPPKARVLLFENVPFIDATALDALRHFRKGSRGALVLGGVSGPVRETLRRSGFLDEIGADNVCAKPEEALERARRLIADQTPAPLPEGRP